MTCSGRSPGGILTPNRSRSAVAMFRDQFGVSERRACIVVGQHRSTQRLTAPPIVNEEARLREFLRAFSKRRPRWGWQRSAKAARKTGWQVNDKRIRRLWRDEGLRVPVKRRKKRLTEIDTHVGTMCPIRPDALLALVFQFDTTADGHTLTTLKVIDEFTRECLAIEVHRTIDANDVVRILDRLVAERGVAPGFVRFDDGPEFIAHTVADRFRFTGTSSIFIDPGSPWQNAWIESFDSRFRDEFLHGRHFDTLLEARVLIEDWRIDYDNNQPHSAYGDLSPIEFAAEWTINQPQAA